MLVVRKSMSMIILSLLYLEAMSISLSFSCQYERTLPVYMTVGALTTVRSLSVIVAGIIVQQTLGFFTNSPQYRNANISNFVLAVPLEINKTNEVYNLGMKSSYTH